METMWTSVSHCEDCVAISWLILVFILHMYLVVAVPVSQLSAVPRKGNRLLLCQLVGCGWFELIKLTADVIVVSLDVYISHMFNSSS